ncbi:MAG TPA: lysine transporter LysE [Chloroflexi bacterium]|nr:lysine transporter LysE [Chloroflexota bacterium]
MLAFFVQGFTLGFSAAAQPGPFQAYLLSQTLKNGWRRTLPAALAPLISDGPIIVLVLLILTQVPGWALRIIQVAGGFFLLYLAWGAYRSAGESGADLAPSPEAAHRSLLEAALTNALGPGPYIFWSLVGGHILLEGWQLSPLIGTGFLLGFYGALIGGSALFVILSSTARQFGPRVTTILRMFSAFALLLLGLYQLWAGLTG